MLLGVDVFLNVLRHGRRSGPPESPTALETEFGWVLCGSAGPASSSSAHACVTTFHSTVTSGDDILRQFWEIEETPADHSILSTEERTVVRHFESNHSCSKEGRFVVPLPRNPSAKQIGELRSQAVRRFVSLEPSLTAKGRFKELDDVMQEYLDLGHAEQIGESRSQAVRRFVSLEPSLTAKGRFKELDDVMQEYLDLGHAEPISSTDLERPIEDVQGYKHYHTSQSSV
jgi:hypothetical protein